MRRTDLLRRLACLIFVEITTKKEMMTICNKLLPLALAGALCWQSSAAQDAAAGATVIDFAQEQPTYDGTHGYDLGTKALTGKGEETMSYSVQVPDGNWRVTVTFGSRRYAGNTTVYAESRRLMAANVTTAKRETKSMTWTIHKRSPQIFETDESGQKKEVARVKTKPREKNYLNWDDRLTLTFVGKPAVSKIEIAPADESTRTLFLCGNSTVVDQENDPWASWGQMITQWFDENVCVANYAESGERTTSFMASKRLDKALSMAKAGDIFVVEFGHNDEKDRGAGSGAWYNFSHNLKTFADRIAAKGCTMVVVSPTARRKFVDGKLQDTHGDYPKAAHAMAEREGLTFVDLTAMSTELFTAMGEEDSKRLLVHYAAGTFPGQDKELADNTHFNPFGAYEIAKCVIMGLKGAAAESKAIADLTGNLRSWTDFVPSKPDDWKSFDVLPVKRYEIVKPDGN